MKTFQKYEQPRDLNPPSSVVTLRILHNAAKAEAMLPASVLNRLCSNDVPNRVRQRNLYRSHVVVALDGDSAVGFAAFSATNGRVRVAHEFWVDRDARLGLTSVAGAILATLEAAVSQAGCSRLFVVIDPETPLCPILEKVGYRVSLASTELIWFEKAVVSDGTPRECA